MQVHNRTRLANVCWINNIHSMVNESNVCISWQLTEVHSVNISSGLESRSAEIVDLLGWWHTCEVKYQQPCRFGPYSSEVQSTTGTGGVYTVKLR